MEKKHVNQIHTGFKVYPDDFRKMKSLRERLGLTWPSYIKYVNRLAEKDINIMIANELKDKEGSKDEKRI